MKRRFPRAFGPFAFQPNNDTRIFEYPWAFHAVPIEHDSLVVEVGGGLGGFQFALASSGANVINVDPGEQAAGRGWPVDGAAIARLNRSFRTSVDLRNTTIDQAHIVSSSVQAVYSISTVEHIPDRDRESVAREIERILLPGGHCVLTVDLFLNLSPFTDRVHNEFGTNVDLLRFVEHSGLEMVQGDPNELFGFPEFRPRAILARLDELLVGGYPAMAQALVLRKRG